VVGVVGQSQRGIRVEVFGLYAILSGATADLSPGEELEVRVTRLDADEGRIFVSDRLQRSREQLSLPI